MAQIGFFVKKATHQDTKKHNTRLVLKTVYDEGQTSRVDIAEMTHLTRPTVSDIVAELVTAGLISEDGVGPSVGGKPPILLSLAENGRCILSLDLANSEFRGAVINLRGKIKHRANVPFHDRDGEAALTLVYQLIETLLEAADEPVLGIGIGTPGLMDADNGIVRTSVNLDWKDLPLKDLLEERYKLPCYVSNDSQVAALAEMAFGAGKSARNLMVVKLGRGVGAGIVINRQLYYGDGFGAGEIGHIVVDEQGDLCNCGRHGCLETIISSRAVIKQARAIAAAQPNSALNKLAKPGDTITADMLAKACEAGDDAIRSMLTSAAMVLGSVLATMAGTLNIEHIVLAGSMATLGNILTEPVQMQVANRILPALAGETRVEVSTLGPDIVLLGSAALILSQELGIA